GRNAAQAHVLGLPVEAELETRDRAARDVAARERGHLAGEGPLHHLLRGHELGRARHRRDRQSRHRQCQEERLLHCCLRPELLEEGASGGPDRYATQVADIAATRGVTAVQIRVSGDPWGSPARHFALTLLSAGFEEL